MAGRGVYRGIYSALPDDPDFQLLSPEARLTLYTVRLCKAAGPAVIFRYYPELLMAQTGLGRKALDRSFEELEAGGWIERESVVLWVRNGLRHDPSIRLADPKHRKAVERAVEELPRLAIVLKFCDYYKIARPFEGPSKTYPDLALRDRDRDPNTEIRIPSNPSPLAEEPTWGRPEHLTDLYNRLAPAELPRVTQLSEGRRKKARHYLAQFPEQTFWNRCFSELRFSSFLKGLRSSNGHEGFRGDFDWLLSKGKDGSENAVKVAEGRYRDKEFAT